MRSTFTNALIQKVLTLVLMVVTGYGVYVITMTKFLSDQYVTLEDTISHMKSLKLNSYPGENVTD